MTKLGPPYKKKIDKKVNRLFSFDLITSKLLDKLVPPRGRSPLVRKSVKKELKKMSKGKTFGMDDEGNIFEIK